MKRTISLIVAMALLLPLTMSGVAFAEAEGNDVVETILNAGTTQAFTDEAVPEADVKTILQAGLAAESAINQQPWYLVAITDKALMQEISAAGGGMPDMPQGGSMPAAPQGGVPGFGGGAKASLGDSPLAIVVYMNEKTASPDPSFDCGLAVQNMYLAAASLGYGVKILSSPTRALNGEDHDRICEKLGVDTSLKAVAVLLIGKADTSADGVSGASVRAGLEEKANIVG